MATAAAINSRLFPLQRAWWRKKITTTSGTSIRKGIQNEQIVLVNGGGERVSFFRSHGLDCHTFHKKTTEGGSWDSGRESSSVQAGQALFVCQPALSTVQFLDSFYPFRCKVFFLLLHLSVFLFLLVFFFSTRLVMFYESISRLSPLFFSRRPQMCCHNGSTYFRSALTVTKFDKSQNHPSTSSQIFPAEERLHIPSAFKASGEKTSRQWRESFWIQMASRSVLGLPNQIGQPKSNCTLIVAVERAKRKNKKTILLLVSSNLAHRESSTNRPGRLQI